MTISITMDVSGIVDTETIDANDVLVALNDLKGALEDYLNGIQAQERTLYVAPTILTIASGVITPTQYVHAVAAQTGTADDLDEITAQNNRKLILKADSGDTITLKHGVDNIFSMSGEDVVLTGSALVELFCLGGVWVIIGDGGAAAATGLTLSDILTVQVFS